MDVVVLLKENGGTLTFTNVGEPKINNVVKIAREGETIAVFSIEIFGGWYNANECTSHVEPRSKPT